jgi:hypothetical protein
MTAAVGKGTRYVPVLTTAVGKGTRYVFNTAADDSQGSRYVCVMTIAVGKGTRYVLDMTADDSQGTRYVPVLTTAVGQRTTCWTVMPGVVHVICKSLRFMVHSIQIGQVIHNKLLTDRVLQGEIDYGRSGK